MLHEMASRRFSSLVPEHIRVLLQARLPALRSRNYRLYWTGQAISLIGTWMQSVAVSWLVWRLSKSPFLLGLVGVAMTLPILVLSLFAGVIADRFVRRRVILVTQTFSMLQAIVLAALATWGHPPVELVLGLVFLMGIINAFDFPARQSFISETVEPGVLPNAIALHSAIFNAARLLGPALAGIVLATLGEAPCFWINALSYVAVLFGLLRMKLPEAAPRAAHGSALAHMKEGVVYAWRTPRLRNLLILLGTAGSFGFQYTVLVPIYADKLLRAGATGYGILMSAAGVGSLLAALTLTGKQDRAKLRRNLLIGLSLFGAGLIGFSLSRVFVLSVALNLVVGFGMVLYGASTNTLVQSAVDDAYRGRVMSLYTLMFIGTAPLGSFVLGSVAQHFGAPWATRISGGLCILGALWVFQRLRVLARTEPPPAPSRTAVA
jgi:MFS family permease